MQRDYRTGNEKVGEVLDILERNYPDATTELKHRSPFQLLIATILSAQTTDRQVNKVTPELFRKFPGPADIAEAPVEEIENMIRTCGCYRSKAKNIKEACGILMERYNGKVPSTVEELMELPGVGRKTANVVASNAFGVAAIAVDTHVFRVSNRIGLVKASDVHKTEEQLMDNIPGEKWSRAHHWLIHHGRRVCKARKPLCHKCPLTHLCDYYQKLVKSSGD